MLCCKALTIGTQQLPNIQPKGSPRPNTNTAPMYQCGHQFALAVKQIEIIGYQISILLSFIHHHQLSLASLHSPRPEPPGIGAKVKLTLNGKKPRAEVSSSGEDSGR